MEQISIEFAAYIGLAFLLYVIRQTDKVPNKYIPIVAVVLGISFSILESGFFNFDVLMKGLQYALLGVGSVATVKYYLEKKEQ
jgi:hypothetical protein